MGFANIYKLWIWPLSFFCMPLGHLFAVPTSDYFIDIERQPDAVWIVTDSASNELQVASAGVWSSDDVKVSFRSRGHGLNVELFAPRTGVKWLKIRWNAKLEPGWKYLGDAWERAYGDLQWKAMDSKRVMPWYFLASNGTLTHGYGVMTGPGALCYWTAAEDGITLHADVRCGGVGVHWGRGT